MNNVLIEENEYYRRNLLKTKKVWPYNRNHNNEVKKNTSNIKKQGIQFQYVYYINDNLIDPDYTTPTDIISMPGIKQLFTSSWDNYNIAAQNFVKENELFNEWL